MRDPFDALRMPFVALITGTGDDADGNEAHSWVEQYRGSEVGTYQSVDDPRQGTLTAYELNGAAVPAGTYVMMHFKAMADAGECAYEFSCTGGAGSGGGPGSGPDGLPDCVIEDYRDECVGGTLYRQKRRVWLDRGCLEAGDWEYEAVLGPCRPDPNPPPPGGCNAFVWRSYYCLSYPGGSGPGAVREAEFLSRAVWDGRCWKQSAETFSRWTGVCCECPVTPAATPCPECDEVDGVDTACCSGVPCDLCLRLQGPADCATAATATLSYSTTPVSVGNANVCGWSLAAPFYWVGGVCQVTEAVLYCVPAAGAVAAHWELKITIDAGGVSTTTVLTLAGVECSPLGLFGQLVPGTACCGDGGLAYVTITPAPCDSDCLPALACGSCPDGAPLVYTVDMTAFAAIDIRFADLTGTQSLLWQGGCFWTAAGSAGSTVELNFTLGTWLLQVTAPDGTLVQSEQWDGDCCDGFTFTGLREGAVTFPDLAIVPATDCCDGGGGGGTVSVDCCPDPLATVLYVRFSVPSANCLCLTGATVTITWDSVAGAWAGAVPASTGCANTPATVALKCFPAEANRWGLIVSGQDFTAFSVSCDPLSIVFHCAMGILGSVCAGGGTVTATVTDVP